MPDRPDQPQPPAAGDASRPGASVPIDLPEPRISAQAQQQLKQAFRRELRVPPQVKLQVLAGAAHSFEQRKYRHRRIMRTQRIAAAVLFLVGTAVAFKYMAPGKNQMPAPQGPIAMKSGASSAADAAGNAQALLDEASGSGAKAKTEQAAPAGLALRAAPASPAATRVADVPADLDSDGTVTILDAFALARVLEPLGGRVTVTSAALASAGFTSADFNHDGFVDDKDVDYLSAQAVSLSPLAMHTGGAR